MTLTCDSVIMVFMALQCTDHKVCKYMDVVIYFMSDLQCNSTLGPCSISIHQARGQKKVE